MGLFSKVKKALKKTVRAVGNVVTAGALKKKEQAKEKAKEAKAAANKQLKAAQQQADQAQNREIQQFADVSAMDDSRAEQGLGSTSITGLEGDMSTAQFKKKRLLGS